MHRVQLATRDPGEALPLLLDLDLAKQVLRDLVSEALDHGVCTGIIRCTSRVQGKLSWEAGAP